MDVVLKKNKWISLYTKDIIYSKYIIYKIYTYTHIYMCIYAKVCNLEKWKFPRVNT